MINILTLLMILTGGLFLFMYKTESNGKTVFIKCFGSVLVLIGLLAFYLIKIECVKFPFL